MKKINSWFASLALVILFSAASQASTFTPEIYPPISKEPTSIKEQVQNYLQGIDLKQLDEEKKVLVDFMLNAKGEILILSTNDSRLDNAIKSRLNYKTISNHDLEVNKTYTLPILFKN